jgi:hypothetical protein
LCACPTVSAKQTEGQTMTDRILAFNLSIEV